MDKIKRVVIVGGTHGNELIGVYLHQKFERYPDLIRRSSFETVSCVGNPQAIAAGVRYIDKDLNRCFTPDDLAQGDSQLYEIQRAREIRSQFGQDGSMPADFIIDQHGTTSNVGTMLILDNLDPFTLRLSAYLNAIQPEIKVYSSAHSGRNQDSLRSLAKYRIGIEVGPVAHGTLHGELFCKTEALIHAILDYLEQHNTKSNNIEPESLTLYQYVDSLDYPRDQQGKLLAMIHPQRQFKDFEALNPGDPIFLTFEGEAIAYAGDSTVYPVFVNEAAYYEKGIAMCLTQKQQVFR